MDTISKSDFLKSLTSRHCKEFNYFINGFDKLEILNPCQLIIFGSSAQMRLKRYSDVDIAVISDYFDYLPWIERISFLKTQLKIDIGVVNPVGLTLTEFDTFEYPSIIRLIRKQGVKIQN